MQKTREQELVKRISDQYGSVIDLRKTPGVLIEILREYGPRLDELLNNGGGGGGGGPTVSSIAIAGPGSGAVTSEDLMRVILELRQEVMKLAERVSRGS